MAILHTIHSEPKICQISLIRQLKTITYLIMIVLLCFHQ